MAYILTGLLIVVFTIFAYIASKTMKVQRLIIAEQRKTIEDVKYETMRITQQYDMYYKAYIELADNYNKMCMASDIKPTATTVKGVIKEYDMDEILQEISKKGIKNIDKQKLEFLKKFSKK
jgi:hypothetical protein